MINGVYTYKKLIKFILPSILMMIVTSVYSIVDGFFVSNLVGKNAFAAVNLVMPVSMALVSFGFMIGTGGSALVATTLGQQKDNLAREYFSMLIKVIIIFGVIVSIIGFIFMPQLVSMLGASELIYQDCVTYGRINIAVITFFMLQTTFQSFLVVAHKQNMGLIISIIAGVTNMVLDYVLIYYFGLGIAGAALATGFSQIVGGIVPMIYFILNKEGRLYLTKSKFRLHILIKTCVNGSSEMLTNISTSVVGILYNFQLLKLAQENGVAAYGVIMYVSFIFSSIFIGYSIGSAPLISYDFGMQDIKKLKAIVKKSMVINLVLALIMTTLSFTTAKMLASIFVGYDNELLLLTTTGLKLYSFSFLISGFNIFGSSLFTALNNGVNSAIISFSRTFLFQVAAIMILPIFFGMNGVWTAILVAELCTIVVTITIFLKNKNEYQYI